MDDDKVHSPAVTAIKIEQMRHDQFLVEAEIDRRIKSLSDIVNLIDIKQHEYINNKLAVANQRFDDMDRATDLLSETVNRVPTDVQKATMQLRSVINERFESVKIQFKERDTRSERESRNNKVAVDAAFAAQKEAASEQNKSNTLAISKSETATSETINKLAELFKTTTDGLNDKIDDLKDRLSTDEIRISTNESFLRGNSVKANQIWGYVVGVIGIVTSIIVSVAYVIKR